MSEKDKEVAEMVVLRLLIKKSSRILHIQAQTQIQEGRFGMSMIEGWKSTVERKKAQKQKE